jgi:hypothetical protein
VLPRSIHVGHTDKWTPQSIGLQGGLTSTLRFSVNKGHRAMRERTQTVYVLEIRETLRDTKEGFTYYIFKAVDEVEDRLTSSDSLDVEEAALKTVQRNLLYEYAEMRRQLEGKRVGLWSNVLAAGSTFLQIDASPWTPKFYGQIIETFFNVIGKTAEAEATSRSNASQAFQYLAQLESTYP